VRVLRTAEFVQWFEELDGSLKARVLARLARVENESHIGQSRDLGGRVSEMKWKQTLRVYYTLLGGEGDEVFVCLLGGDKDGQTEDIEKAKRLVEEIHK